ncbi:MAG: RnfABCDGE type electron transport complex subunit E, partial [Leptospiraceae bacterium]|nr:RnfABCDGE type electron transport complex subunit E [Leptospiraceae bacterium]
MAAAKKEVQNFDIFIKSLWKENPVFAQLLGLCPTLAVSNSVSNAIAMGLATSFVVIMSSFLVSSLRKTIPKEVRIAAFILIIATYVTIAEYLIQAVSLEVHKSLGAFIALIVVNCQILGRQEAFASRNPVWPSIVDAAGTGSGFLIAIVSMGVIREVLGAGTFMGVPLFGPNYEPWVIMILPGGGFFVLGFLLLVYVTI